MYWYIVIKQIKCLPCDYVIDVKKFSTTQGADTPADKALQDTYIHSLINSRQLLGFPICPKCKKRASIVDPPEPKPLPPPEIDIDTARQKYDALLKLKSVAPDTAGKYPPFEAFCDYLKKCRVQIIYDHRTITRIFIAGDNFKMDYAFVP